MSMAGRQRTCACCGKLINLAEYELEILVDPSIRYVVTCCGCHTFVHRSETNHFDDESGKDDLTEQAN